MAIQPKGSKVTGTKKKDKITWVSSKAWKKALTVNAGSGNDVINFKKSKYKNKLNGQNGNDTVYGGTKYDTIHGNTGNDKLYGYNGNDKIYGDSGKDTIYGGNNNDYINGGDSDDKLYGQNGNDTIYAGKGNDYIDGGNNNDKIYGNYGTNTLKGGIGNDSIYAGTGTDKIWGGAGNDLIDLAKGGTNTVYGEAGTDKIINIKGNATVDGGADNDTIIAVLGDNTLNGGSGNDVIYSGDGSALITGGTGDDEMHSGTGNNTYIFNACDGHDVIYSGTGTDTISFGTSKNNNYQQKIGNDLVIYSTEIDYITLKDFFNDNHSTQYVSFSDRPEPSLITDNWIYILSSGEITGTKYVDLIQGSDGADVITAGQVHYDDDECYDHVDSGLGEDIINIQENGRIYIDVWHWDNMTINGVSTAKTVLIAPTYDVFIYGYQNGDDYTIVKEDVILVDSVRTVRKQETTLTNFTLSEHPDLVIMENTDYASLTHYNYDDITPDTNVITLYDSHQLDLSDSTDNLYILGGNLNDYIQLGHGDDTIHAGNGNNGITAWYGNNKIYTGNGDDYILAHVGHSDIYAGDGKNTIEVDAATVDVITGKDNDTIRFTTGSVKSGAGNDSISIWRDGGSTSGIGEITAGEGNDIIDAVYAYTGSSYTINYALGDGSDTIRNLTANGEYNFIIGTDFIVRHNSENSRNLEIVMLNDKELDEDNKITIENYWNENFVSEDDVINSNIKINGTNIQTDGVFAFPNEVLVANSTLVSATDANELIYGTSENDSIEGGGGNDIIYSGTGNDTISLTGEGTVTVYYNEDDGDLTIKNFGNNKNVNLYMEGIANDTITVEKHNTDMYLVRSNGEMAILNGIYNASGTITGNVNLYREDGTLIGSLSDYVQSGNVEVNVYPDYSGNLIGDRQTTKNIFHPQSSTDTISISNVRTCDNKIVSADFRNIEYTWCRANATKYERDGNNLKVTAAFNMNYTGEGGIWADSNTVTTVIDNYFLAQGDLTHNVTYYDNVVMQLNYNGETLSTVIDRSESTDANIFGTNLNDSITGGTYDGNLNFDGGQGNDTITGRSGMNDFFNFFKGDGHDIIFGGDSSEGDADMISIYGYENANASNFEDWEYEFTGENGNDLTIKYNHIDNVPQDSITIKNYLTDGAPNSSIKYAQVGNVNYGSSGQYLLTQVLGQKINRTSGLAAESITGSLFDDSISGYSADTVNGGLGNDTITYRNSESNPVTIYGGAGNDSMEGSTKNDHIEGGTGNDFLWGGAGNDVLKGDDGNDTIEGGAGADSIWGGKGDDSIDGGSGNDTIYADQGNDTITCGAGYDSIDAAYGVNTINFASGDGYDTVNFYYSGGNTLKFTDKKYTDFSSFYLNTLNGKYDFVIKYDTSDQVTVQGMDLVTYMWVEDEDSVKRGVFTFKNAGNYYTNQSSLDDYIFGSTGNDTLRGSWGNDTIKGGTGNDTYVFNKMANANAGQYDGNDEIHGAVGSTYSSTLVFGEIENNSYTNMINYTDMEFSVDNNDLLIKYDYFNDDYISSVRIKDYVSSNNAIKNIVAGVDGIATNKTLYEVLAAQHLYISTSDIDASEGNDTITALSGCTYVNGGEGSDTITSKANNISIFTYMNVFNTQGIDSTEGTIDTVTVNGTTNTIYAQSETNIISSTKTTSNDRYFVHLSQKTEITDNGGDSDSLKLRNSYNISDTDGIKDNTHILFNVAADYDYDETDETTLFDGNLFVTNTATKENYDLWQANGTYTGVSVKNNTVETIYSSDNYQLTKAEISTLAESVAGWLTTNGYADVAEVFATEDNETDIAALVAKFDTANWQASV